MNRLKYICSIILLLSASSTEIYSRSIKNDKGISDDSIDIELSTQDQSYIDNLLASELDETENKAANIGLRGPGGPCMPLPAEFPVNTTISTLASVGFGETYSYNIRFSSPLRPIEAGDLVLIHTLPTNVTLLAINENQPITRRIVCNRTSFSVCIRRDSTRDRYKICLINNQAIEANTEISVSFIVRAPRRAFTIISRTALQARSYSGRIRNIDNPVITIRTRVGNATSIPVVKTDTTMLEALSI